MELLTSIFILKRIFFKKLATDYTILRKSNLPEIDQIRCYLKHIILQHMLCSRPVQRLQKGQELLCRKKQLAVSSKADTTDILHAVSDMYGPLSCGACLFLPCAEHFSSILLRLVVAGLNPQCLTCPTPCPVYCLPEDSLLAVLDITCHGHTQSLHAGSSYIHTRICYLCPSARVSNRDFPSWSRII